MNYIYKPCLIITIIGAINYCLISLFNFDIIKFITMNEFNLATRILYVVIALSGFVTIPILFIDLNKNEI